MVLEGGYPDEPKDVAGKEPDEFCEELATRVETLLIGEWSEAAARRNEHEQEGKET